MATLDAAYPRAPSRVFGSEAVFAVSTESGTAKFRDDFAPFTEVISVGSDNFQQVGGQYVARTRIANFDILDDMVYEVSEQFLLKLERGGNLNTNVFRIQKPDGTASGSYDVIITDDEDRPILSLSVGPPSIAEEDDDGTTTVAENVSTVTVAITNGKTFVGEETVTLTFSGDATEGTHYSVNPTDADTNAAGHQVLLPAETPSVPVTVTATANDTADGNRTVTVAGEFDGTAIGSRDITILDDDTTTTNTAATGAPVIMGTPQEGHELTATLGSMADTDVLPATFPDDYDFPVGAVGQHEQSDQCRHEQQHLHGAAGGRGLHDQGGREFHRRRGQPGGSAHEHRGRPGSGVAAGAVVRGDPGGCR